MGHNASFDASFARSFTGNSLERWSAATTMPPLYCKCCARIIDYAQAAAAAFFPSSPSKSYLHLLYHHLLYSAVEVTENVTRVVFVAVDGSPKRQQPHPTVLTCLDSGVS